MPISDTTARCPNSIPTLWYLRFPDERHPHDRVAPFFKFATDAKVSLPQSHTHFHTTELPDLLSVGSTATSLPNRWPLTSAIFRPRQPQDATFP